MSNLFWSFDADNQILIVYKEEEERIRVLLLTWFSGWMCWLMAVWLFLVILFARRDLCSRGCLAMGRRWALCDFLGGRCLKAFARAGDVRRPVLTRSVVPANDMYLGDRPAIRLSRMAVARDMIA